MFGKGVISEVVGVIADDSFWAGIGAELVSGCCLVGARDFTGSVSPDGGVWVLLEWLGFFSDCLKGGVGVDGKCLTGSFPMIEGGSSFVRRLSVSN